MPDPTAAAPAAPAATTNQRDPKSVAGNITDSIARRANGNNPPAPPASDPKAPPATVDPNAGKEKYIVNDREIWLTPEQARAYVQKGIAFEPKVDQLNRLQNETIQFQRALLNDPLTVLKNMAQQQNIPISKLYEKVLDGDWPDDVKEIVGKRYYNNVVEPSRLTPEQLKAREDAKYREERERQDASAKDQAIKQENQKRVETTMLQIKAQIAEAMKDSGLANNNTPLGAEMARMVAETMNIARFQKQTITPKQAIEFVKKRLRHVNTAYYETLEGEQLIEALGPNVSDRVKKHFLKLAQSNGVNPTGSPKIPRSAVRNGERDTINQDDFHDYLEKRKREG